MYTNSLAACPADFLEKGTKGLPGSSLAGNKLSPDGLVAVVAHMFFLWLLGSVRRKTDKKIILGKEFKTYIYITFFLTFYSFIDYLFKYVKGLHMIKFKKIMKLNDLHW